MMMMTEMMMRMMTKMIIMMMIMTMHDNMNIVDDNCDGTDEDRKKDTSDLLKNIPHIHHHDQCDDHPNETI